LLHFVRLRAGDRKLRLFAAACCRLVWEDLPGQPSWHGVETAERYADDLVGDLEREATLRAVRLDLWPYRGKKARLAQAVAETLRARFSPLTVARRALTGRKSHELPPRQADIARDLFGNPFQTARIDRAWLRHEGLVALAQSIHTSRLFHLMPTLADHLEQAGCTNSAILDHCHLQPDHWPGCWLLDRLLGHI
jgi:hypothetical protein